MKVVARGGAVLCSFIDWFLLLFASLLVARCLLGVSLVSSPFLLCNLEHLFVVVREIELEGMGDDPLDRDARIKFTIGTKEQGDANGMFSMARGMAFERGGLLFVADYKNHRVQVFSSDDGSFVSRFGERGDRSAQFSHTGDVAIDHDHDRILIVDASNGRIQSWSLSSQAFLSSIGKRGRGDLEFRYPRCIAIDKHHHRIIVADTHNYRLVFLSSIDLSFLFSVGNEGSRPGEFKYHHGLAIDDDRHRIIVCDTNNHRVQVLSLIDGSFLFEFGSYGDQPCQFNRPHGLCIDNQGRIIVADWFNCRLQSFTHEGHHISSFDCGTENPLDVAFDEHRGLIAFSAGHRVHVIGANQWLADTFTWRPDLHRYAPKSIKQAVSTMTMIRSVVDDSAMSMIPNELLFEIFSFL